MIVIDLFSGAGGLSEGFHEEGYKIVAQVEKEKWACETLKTRMMFHYFKDNNDLEKYHRYLKSGTNYRDLDAKREYFLKDYPELKHKMEREIINRKFGNPNNDEEATSSSEIINMIADSLILNKASAVDLIIGGPPCQAYSLIGRSRMRESVQKDSRNYLFYYYLNIVKEFKPKAFIFENVPGILTAQKGQSFQRIQEEFDRIGYKILTGKSNSHTDNIINFGDYGVIQRRKRVLLFGFKKALNYTYPDFDSNKLNWNEVLNTKNALGDLPSLQPGQGDDWMLYEYNTSNENLSNYQKKMRENSVGFVNHKARRVHPRDREIYKIVLENLAYGKLTKYNELPSNLKTHKNQDSFLDRFKVHGWNSIPHTVVAHISKDGHYNIHPDISQVRSLTVREAARIQSFPDNYKFEGPRTAQFTQVGNAVPPIMSSVIAKAIKKLIE